MRYLVVDRETGRMVSLVASVRAADRIVYLGGKDRSGEWRLSTRVHYPGDPLPEPV